MESNVETTTLDNLSEDEQDSLAVGEKMEEAQEQLLAGKYKSAEELEKGYLELQQKLSNKEEPEAEAETETEETAEPNILDRVWDEATSGNDFTPELTEELNKMAPQDLANLYLDYRQNNQNAQPESRDFSEENIKELKGIVGGEENYTNMVQGKAPRQSNDQFRSQQEVVKAMGDPRYEEDPAYRRDIMEKLQRSPNVNF